MGFRFQKRVRILPGVTLNFSKSGVSTSLGVRGARITKGHGKTRVTVGIPGSGLSYTEVVRAPRKAAVSKKEAQPQAQGGTRWRVVIAVAVGIFLMLVLLPAFAQVRCTMPNGVVIEQRLSNVCPAGARAAYHADGSPAGTRGLTRVEPQPITTDKRWVKRQDVSRAEFGGAWPLTVEKGTLRCMYPDSQRPQLHALLIVVDGVFYTLNGTAGTHAARMGWRDVRAIWRDDPHNPGTKIALAPLMERAQVLCS